MATLHGAKSKLEGDASDICRVVIAHADVFGTKEAAKLAVPRGLVKGNMTDIITECTVP